MNFKIFQSLFNLGFITGVFKLVFPYLAILSTYTHAKKTLSIIHAFPSLKGKFKSCGHLYS